MTVRFLQGLLQGILFAAACLATALYAPLAWEWLAAFLTRRL